MKNVWIGSFALIGATLGSVAAAEPAGTLLFTQPGTQILDAQGVPRPAQRGDVVQTGERLLTPPGGISQIKLPDGSLIGMRPDSELKLDLPPVVGVKAPHAVALVRGGARIIGAELMDAKKISNFTFQSGPAVLKLQGADLESAVIPAGEKLGKPMPGVGAPGSYQRLLIGAGTVGNGPLVEALAPRQVSFVGGVNVAPVTVASFSPTLFTGNRLADMPPLSAPPPIKGGDPVPRDPFVQTFPTGPKLPVLSTDFPPKVPNIPVFPVLTKIGDLPPFPTPLPPRPPLPNPEPIVFQRPPIILTINAPPPVIQPVPFIPPPTIKIVTTCILSTACL